MTKSVTDYRNDMLAAIDARASYEANKNTDNLSMQKTLTEIRKSVDHESIAQVMLAANVNAAFINRAERSNNRYNVYAAEKVVNIARALAHVATLNHYTRAIVASALALEEKDYTLTHRDAACACSASVKHTDSKREAIIKHVRYTNHVSQNTASTQSSSSLNALVTCNVLVEQKDAANITIYRVNKSHDLIAQFV